MKKTIKRVAKKKVVKKASCVYKAEIKKLKGLLKTSEENGVAYRNSYLGVINQSGKIQSKLVEARTANLKMGSANESYKREINGLTLQIDALREQRNEGLDCLAISQSRYELCKTDLVIAEARTEIEDQFGEYNE